MNERYEDLPIELSYDEMIRIQGGGILSEFVNAVKSAGQVVGYGVGYAVGIVKDFVTSGSSAANETLMNCI
ncbi:MAG: hypothetical protein PHC38_06895 [Weeksellaceae bacterium]|nr:hypothetical protein [Weeksellaceae bacterium]